MVTFSQDEAFLEYKTLYLYLGNGTTCPHQQETEESTESSVTSGILDNSIFRSKCYIYYNCKSNLNNSKLFKFVFVLVSTPVISLGTQVSRPIFL